ncbi:beta-propeller domain-containing protein [Heliomicrobium modesticaldum]|uniref:beta-propeller domain-containing protein n=1 Tax=Heliomicrobium modesticaldum TaxID=35701 RepID=UPI000673DD70|nr:beta-propeller domain-containing protein [Heliomicrobium modesticaldum]
MGILKKQKRWVSRALIAAIFSSVLMSGCQALAAGGSTDQEGLPVVGSYGNLKRWVEKAAAHANRYKGGAAPEAAQSATKANAGWAERRAVTSAPSAQAPSADRPSGAEASVAKRDYSTTNVQVEGVDEADIVKTDGGYIYQVNNRRVIIAKAHPVGQLAIASVITFDDAFFAPREIYVDAEHLIVIGSGRDEAFFVPTDGTAKRAMIAPPYRPYQGTVKAIVYDIANKAHPQKLRETILEGNYVSSRKIGASLYLIANRYLGVSLPEKETPEVLPWYKDTATGAEKARIGYDQIRCFPDFMEPNYLIVAAVNTENPKESPHLSTYLGAGETVYASTKNLYVALHTYRGPVFRIMGGERAWPQTAPEEKTRLFKFALEGAKTRYVGMGEAPGRVLNQFSMDEKDGFFRIATTVGSPWAQGADTSKNNLYILDESLKPVGKLEGIAPGEQIYSVRFMGEKAYMVTFRTVDPLFVIDLKEPKAPRILGKLKIPGYSNYLHPYDDNHIIGFGKDTIEQSITDHEGRVIGTNAYYQGMKMALFDVSDVEHPVEKHVAFIGDRGTDSELLYDHRALLFSKEKRLLAFPVQLMEVDKPTGAPSGEKVSPVPAYGTFAFQGAYVYTVGLEKGFELRGRITHLSDEDYQKAGQYYYDSEKFVNRILFINDSLYTLSNRMIKAHGMDTLEERGNLAIPGE